MSSRASAAWPSIRIAIATSTAMVSTCRSSPAEPVPPHLQRILSELHRLDVAAAQVQSPHLVDDQAAQGRVGGVEEAAIGLKMLQGQVIDRVVATAVRVTRVGFGEQGIDGRPVRRGTRSGRFCRSWPLVTAWTTRCIWI